MIDDQVFTDICDELGCTYDNEAALLAIANLKRGIGSPTKAVLEEIAARREHQVSKGYDAAHDDKHDDGSIARGAAALALSAFGPVTLLADRRRNGMYRGREELTVVPEFLWPWENGFKPGSPRDSLIDAATMIVAEIERIDRVGPSSHKASEESHD